MPCHDPSTISTLNAGLRSQQAIQREFPQFVIWREALRDRIRYIARARDLSTPLHTVVTADLEELRAALADAIPRSGPASGGDGPKSPACTRPPPACRAPSHTGCQPTRPITAFTDLRVLALVLAGLRRLPTAPPPSQRATRIPS